MYIEPLYGETDLTRIHRGACVQLWRDLLRIDVIEHNGCVVAAKFQRQSLQGPGDTCHYLLARRSRAGEGYLRDVGMGRQSLTKIVLIDDDIDHAGRQYFRTEFAEAEGYQRSRRRRLYDYCVPGKERRRDLHHQQNHRKIPGGDRGNDPEWRMLPEDFLPLVLF